MVIGLYMLLALVLTWPLAPNFAMHVAGDGSDDPALTWNLWWFKHAVIDLQTTPLVTDFMFYPIGINLVFYTLTLLNDAMALPLYALFGLVPAANVNLIISFALSGYGACLLAAYMLSDQRKRGEEAGLFYSTLVAGALYAFSANKMLYASLGQFNIASSQWIPFYTLFLFKIGASPRSLRYPLLAAAFLLLQAYAEPTFASFLLVQTAIFAISRIRPVKEFLRLVRPLVLCSGLFVVGFAPILVPMVLELRLEGDILLQGSGFAEAFSADMLGFFVPSRLHPFLGWVEQRLLFQYVNFAFVGWSTIALALAASWHNRSSQTVKFWMGSTLLFAVIALGPALHVNGNTFDLPLPFDLFQSLPFFRGNRYPSRYSVMITLGMAMLVAYELRRLAGLARKSEGSGSYGSRVPPILKRLCLAGVPLILLAEHLSVPLPLSDFRVPGFYHEIRAEPGDFTVLELPVAWRNGFRVTGTSDKVFMLSQYYQTVHQKRMISGNTSRNPEFKFQYFTEAPVINSLIALETGHTLDDTTRERDRRIAGAVFRFLDVRYIVVRPEAGQAVEVYLAEILPDLKLWHKDERVRLYRIDPLPLDDRVGIDLSIDIARIHLAEGWSERDPSGVARAQRTHARLLVRAAGGAKTVRAQWKASEPQIVDLYVNGLPAARGGLAPDRPQLDLQVPPGVFRDGMNELLFQFEYMRPSGSQSNEPISLVVKSAGMEVGDFAHIWINGIDVSPNRRGFNIVVIDSSGRSLQAESFDTFASEDESARMAAFLQSIEPGRRIAIAVRDEASRHLTAAAVDALRQFGPQADLRGKWRWSYSALSAGRHGTAPSAEVLSVVEELTETNVARIVIGPGLTEPQMGPGLAGNIVVEPASAR